MARVMWFNLGVMPRAIYKVATNVIAGFLGVGKTSAILRLFARKPAGERWAVLVNEFGKIGIDGKLYQASGIAVKEIPGGCICCAQGLPLQVALNRLLRETRPQRLLLESSGIGHPAGVLKTLQGDHFNRVLQLNAMISLLDPRHLLQPNYIGNALFREQLQRADVLVANKTDLASSDALAAFAELASTLHPDKVRTACTTHGMLQTDWLDLPHRARTTDKTFSLKLTPQARHWQTHSVRFSATTRFDKQALQNWLDTQSFLRVKGLLQTTEGCVLLNVASGKSEFVPLANRPDNHLEFINPQLNIAAIEQALQQCRA